MDQKCDILYPSAPLEKDDLEQRLEKKLKDVNCFNYSNNNNKEMNTYFKEKDNRSKKKYKKYKTIITILKSFDTFVNIATTSSSVTLSFTRIGLTAIPYQNQLQQHADYQLVIN